MSQRLAKSATCRSVIAIVLGAMAVPAVGEAPGMKDAELETVMVYARRLTPVSRVAATVTTVDRDRIGAILATDVRDIVRYEPGVSVRADPFRFGLDTISIRGLGGNRVAVELDGIPAAQGFAVGSYADSGRAFIDPAFVDRVEILRGPASSLYGSDAIGGVVAMTTVSPATLLGPAAAERHALRTEAGFDTENDAWRIAAMAAGEAGPVRWLLGYAQHAGEEGDTAARVRPDPSEFDSDSALLQVTGDPTGGPLLLTLEAGRLRQQTSVDAFLGVGRFLNTTALEGDDEISRYRASLQQSLRTPSVAFDSAQWSLYRQGTATTQDTFETRRAVPPRSPAVQLDRAFEFDEDTFGAEFTAQKSFATGQPAHELVYGLEATHSSIEELRRGRQTTLATGATTDTILGETFPLRDLPLSTVTEIGVFVQDEMRFGKSRWSLVPALRVDYYELSPSQDAIYRQDNPGAAPVGVDEVSLAPKLGVLYQLHPRLGMFLQYAHGFRSPPPEDVNIGLEIPLFNVRAIPNPELRPETSDGFEAGMRLAGSLLSGTLSLFHTEYNDFIESKVNLGADPVTGTTLFQSQNVAEARIYGAEVDLRVDASRWSRRLEGWTGRFATSWTRGDDLVRDEPLNSIDPPRLVLGVRYDAPSRSWGTEFVLTAVEAQRNVDRSRADLYRTDGYATLDWLANVSLSPRLMLQVGLFNVADTRYIEWADVRGRAVDDPLVPYYTRAGFNASASLRYDF